MEEMQVVAYPHEALTTVCKPVDDFSARLHGILDGMRPLMEKERGIGLAANQVGITERFFIMKDQKGNIVEFINPEIIDKEGGTMINEGCLSAKGVYVSVPRWQTITVKAFDRTGNEFRIVAQDIEAICIQHEMDHLDGVFFLSKTSRQQRKAAMKQLGLK